MKFSLNINQKFCVEHSLSLSESILFAWLYELPSWADKIVYGESTYYFAARKKALAELPLISDKPDTFYRLYKSLQNKGLITYIKVDGKEYIALTDEGKKWYYHDKNEIQDNIDENKDFPKTGNKFGKSRKKVQNESEINPTYNIYKRDNIDNYNREYREKDFSRTRSTEDEIPEEKEEGSKRLFRGFYSGVDNGDFEELNQTFSGPEYANIDLVYYYLCVADWSDSANKKRTKRGWIATIRNFIKSDNERGKLHTLKKESRFNIDEINAYINHEY